jgi:secondary thiamine-phosphate synthase enzyme
MAHDFALPRSVGSASGLGAARSRHAGRFHLVNTRILTVRTGSARGLADLTAACSAFLADLEAEDGLLSLFVPHATAGLVVLEVGAGSDDDLLDALDRLLPREDRWYRHRHGSPGHGADHVLPLLVSPSLTVPVVDGRVALGTWQSICLLDPNADNATREVRLSFLAG